MRNDIHLTPTEARVIGALIEKEITTPDQYPLSLNALKLACNQKSSRDPVMSLDEDDVLQALDSLRAKHLVLERSGFGSRVPKFRQRFCNTEFASLQFTDEERAIICALILRGPQTPGQLRAHTHRLCDFTDTEQVEDALRKLTERPDGPFVARLPREPGRREHRFMHLFSDREPDPGLTAGEPGTIGTAGQVQATDDDPLVALERRVAVLERELEAIRARLSPPDND